jgi:hypothetical protein
MPGNLIAPNQGQPNGNRPRSAVTQTLAGAGAGGPMPYGMKSQLQSAAAQTPAPPGVSPDAHAAHVALRAHLAANPVTPLSAPTQNPLEPVTAGAPLDPGPTNPMAAMPAQDISVANILAQAAAASPSPALRALAARANAALNDAPNAPGML